MKRLIAVLGSTLFFLIACGPGDGAQVKTTASSETQSTEVVEGAAAQDEASTDTVTVTLSFDTNASGVLYAAWVEDEDGNLVETLYAGNALMRSRSGSFNGAGYLTGDALPYFKTKFGWEPGDRSWLYPEDVLDGVTGASPASGDAVAISRTVDLGGTTRFRICFEVDTSINTNDYFQDRPAFTYKTQLIDAVSAAGTYEPALDGWMGNTTDGNPYGQDPRREIEDYEAFRYMQGPEYLPYVMDPDGGYDSIVSNAAASVN